MKRARRFAQQQRAAKYVVTRTLRYILLARQGMNNPAIVAVSYHKQYICGILRFDRAKRSE